MLDAVKFHDLPGAVAAVVAPVARSGVVTRGDVMRLRAVFAADVAVGRPEAEALFAVDSACARKDPDWTGFFVDTISDHVVWQMRPTGVLAAEQAEWLVAQADAAGTLNAFAVLIDVLAEAHRVPPSFRTAVRVRAARGWPGVAEAARGADIIAARQLDGVFALT